MKEFRLENYTTRNQQIAIRGICDGIINFGIGYMIGLIMYFIFY
jgi:hypothetical protein